MLKDALEEEAEGFIANGQNINNLYDAMFLSDNRTKLQRIIDKVVRICEEYNMEINTKKTKVMVFSKKQGTKMLLKLTVKSWKRCLVISILGAG